VSVSREEWIGVPVPDPGIPREWVLAARDAIKNNEKVFNCGRRFYRTTRIERLEQHRDALLSHYSQLAVERLDNLEPEERNRVYKMLDLKVLAHEDGYLEVKWTLVGNLCNSR
jgi:hypothetical protein